MSLWPVEDESTRDWMIDLYEARFQNKMDTAAAVRHATRKALEGQRKSHVSSSPFFWAGFVASGDWR
jgi:CHAT domain-containing protein